MEEDKNQDFRDEPPPIFGAWKRLYIAVLVVHAVIIFLFWLFTKIYS